MKHVVYILWSEKLGQYYCGQTNDLEDRLYRHNTSQSKSTRRGVPWVLVLSVDVESRSEAVRLERKIKNRGVPTIHHIKAPRRPYYAKFSTDGNKVYFMMEAGLVKYLSTTSDITASATIDTTCTLSSSMLNFLVVK